MCSFNGSPLWPVSLSVPLPWLRATPTAARPERSIVLLSNKGEEEEEEEEEEGGEPRGEASTQVPSLPVPRGQSCGRVGNRPFPTNALHHSYGNENGQHSFLGGNEFCLDEGKNYRLWREWKAKAGLLPDRVKRRVVLKGNLLR